MTGQIALFIRLLLLPVAGWLAGTGLVTYGEAAGTLAISRDDLGRGWCCGPRRWPGRAW